MIIWLASYPRSGNTFLRILIKRFFGSDTYSIYNDREIGADAGLADLTGHRPLDKSMAESGFDLESLRSDERLFFLKTHEQDKRLVEPEDKIIYVVRDGREAVLSFQRYLLKFHGVHAPLSALLLGLRFPGVTWGEHVRNWIAGGADKLLLLKFEELISQPQTAVESIARFLQIPFAEAEIPTFDELNATNPAFFSRGQTQSFKKELEPANELVLMLSGATQLDSLGYVKALPKAISNLQLESLEKWEEDWLDGEDGLAKLREHHQETLNSLKAQIAEAGEEARRNKPKIDALTNAARRDAAAIAKASRENEALQRRLHESVAEKERLQLRLRESAAEKEVLQHRLNESALSIEKARQDYAMLRADLDAIAAERDDLRSQMERVQKSLSWKLTLPLRALRILVQDSHKFWRLVKSRTRK